MSEKSMMEIDDLKFSGPLKEYSLRKETELGIILGAKWTINVCFYFPLGLKKTIRPSIRSKRARITFKCEGLPRKVLAKGNITIENLVFDKPINKNEIFQNTFTEGDSFFEVDVSLGHIFVLEIPPTITLKGELHFQVSPENFFYYKFQGNHMPSNTDLEDCRTQISNELSDDFGTIFHKQEFSDVVIRCESREFNVHKVILFSRSPVFAKMFQTEMKEAKENVICIDNKSASILEAVLDYIYSGKIVSLTDSNAGDLLSASDEYQLLGLKKACLIYLQSSLTKDNALSTLAYADLYDESLKKISIDFICKEFDNLKITEEWKKFQKERAVLANEILINIIEFTKSGNN